MVRMLLALLTLASMTLLSIAAPVPKPSPPKGDDKMVPGPWYSAKVGDVLVKRDSLNQTSTWKVTKVDDANVTFETCGVARGGRVTPGQTFTKPRMVPKDSPFVEALAMDSNLEVKEVGTETLTVSGKKIVCQVKQTSRVQSDNTTLVRKYWTSLDIPGRLVKVQTTSPKLDYVNELVEFKRK